MKALAHEGAVIMGSATFFDAFDALALAFVLSVLVGLRHLTTAQVGVLLAAGYLAARSCSVLWPSATDACPPSR